MSEQRIYESTPVADVVITAMVCVTVVACVFLLTRCAERNAPRKVDTAFSWLPALPEPLSPPTFLELPRQDPPK